MFPGVIRLPSSVEIVLVVFISSVIVGIIIGLVFTGVVVGGIVDVGGTEVVVGEIVVEGIVVVVVGVVPDCMVRFGIILAIKSWISNNE